MEKRRAVIFDWGGVLMRTQNYAPRLAWDKRLGLAPGSVERIVHGIPEWRQAQLGTIAPQVYWQAVAQRLGLSAAEAAALRHDFYSGDQLDEALVALIRDVRTWGAHIGLLSNNTLDLRREITSLGLDGLFDACVISAEIGAMKPEEAAYRAILNRLQVHPQQALLIDDSVENVAGAWAVGMQAVRFMPQIDLRALLEAWWSKQHG